MKLKLNIWLTLSLFIVNTLLISMVFTILYTSLERELIHRTHEQLKSVNILKKKLLDQFLMDKYEEASHIIEYFKTHSTSQADLTERLLAISDVTEVKIHGPEEQLKLNPDSAFHAHYKGSVSYFNFYFLVDTFTVELVFGFNTIENILQERTGLGATGESYLVSEDRKMMTSSYFFPKQLPYTIEAGTKGVNKAFQHIEDVEIYPDYRGVSIIGSYRIMNFHGINAALLTEMDYEEAMEPIIQIRNELLVLLAFLLVFLLIISAGFAQVVAIPILKLQEVASDLSKGELPSKLPPPGFIYELSEITSSVNQLIQAMKQTVIFAEEIGHGRMDEPYKPLGEKDELGLAILQMRDQLVKLDNEKSELELQAKRILIDTQEKERERIARDLHDGLGTMLTTLKLRMENSGLLQNNGEELRGLLDKTIMETRLLARNLMPSVLMDFGLNEALTQLIKEIQTNTNINVLFVNELEGSGMRLDKTKRVGIYRIAQEAINNALKHSKCTEITVSITSFDDYIVLFIKDNGTGFKEDQKPGTGLGLKNMDERSRAMNGQLILESGEEGTIIEVVIPL